MQTAFDKLMGEGKHQEAADLAIGWIKDRGPTDAQLLANKELWESASANIAKSNPSIVTKAAEAAASRATAEKAAVGAAQTVAASDVTRAPLFAGMSRTTMATYAGVGVLAAGAAYLAVRHVKNKRAQAKEDQPWADRIAAERAMAQQAAMRPTGILQ